MAIKRKGILAVPGEYHYGEKTERKTAEELKAAAERQPIVALTYGHPAGGIPKASDFIGTVNQTWNEEKQRVDGVFWFYDEVPDEIRNKVVNGWPTPISAGFTVDKVENDTQKGIFYTHIAVLKDSDDPKCPLNRCGVNVRMESSSPTTDYRYEQAQSSDPEAKPMPKKEPEKAASAISDEPTWAAELKQSIQAMLERFPAVPKTEEKKTAPEVPPKVEEVRTPEVVEPPKPKTVIPAGAGAAKKEDLNDDGWYEIYFGKKK